MSEKNSSGESINFVADDMTLGDLEEFEEIVGKSLDEAISERVVRDPETKKPVRGEDGKPVKETRASAKAIVAMVFLAKRKADPSFTLQDARNVKVSEMVIDLGDADENPTEADAD